VVDSDCEVDWKRVVLCGTVVEEILVDITIPSVVVGSAKVVVLSAIVTVVVAGTVGSADVVVSMVIVAIVVVAATVADDVADVVTAVVAASVVPAAAEHIFHPFLFTE